MPAAADRLARRGEGPVAISLRADETRTLDPDLTHGAVISLGTG